MSANHVLLQRLEVTNSTSTIVSFRNIPQTGYTDLKIVVSGRTVRSGTDRSNDFLLTFNDSASGYSRKDLGDSPVRSTGGSSLSNIGRIQMPSDDATANTFGNAEIYIANYTSSQNKAVTIDNVSQDNNTYGPTWLVAGLWSSSTPVYSISLTADQSGTITAGSTFSLYGIAKLGTAPAIAPKATGGDIIANDGEYWYHAFLTTGAFKPKATLNCDYLVIAGGGAGGSSPNGQQGGGGGGAGGYLSSVFGSGGGGSAGAPLTLSIGTSYTASIGAGGTTNASGGNTTFVGLTAIGGGYGGVASGNGANGGSGGGGSSSSSPGSGGTGTSGQGYAGGAAQGGNNYACGGGGGAGAVGYSGALGSDALKGQGGAGVAYASSFAYATGTGVNGYFAGGGGGGFGQFGGNGGNLGGGWGGVGGGGYGATSTSSTSVATAGTANTGSGGGGSAESGRYTNSAVGGNGGSGIVIVRYAMA